MRSLGSNVGIGLDPDGFSSSLDLMKTVGAFCSVEEPSGYPSGDPEEILSSEGSEDDRIPSTTPGAEPPRDVKDSGSARSHSTHLETSSSNRP